MSKFSVEDYDFSLPEQLIAQAPVEPRDHSRLLVLDRKTKTWEHRHFYDLPEYFNDQDVFVANNSKVIRARLLGRRIREENGEKVLGGRVEFLLLEKKQSKTWEGLMHASAKYKVGFEFEVLYGHKEQWITGKVIEGSESSEWGTVIVEFDQDPTEVEAGDMPLPPYIHRRSNISDLKSYQTVYAKELGSAAAPTAGFHFTPDVLEKLKTKKSSWEEVTLHVGLGTFRPVKAQDIREHQMHEERYEVSSQTAESLLNAKKNNKRITAVGTTAVRTLESAWSVKDNQFKTGAQRTSIFLYPGAAEFHVVDRLLTNFHLPKSTLLMLVSAFADRDFILAAYQEAIAKKYRFFSYGDAMLIL